ncbi:MAG: cell division protein FtsQ/DivIB [Candidatus Omnitrophica bacterium]|nr:cell division protein FtsQ/DivIB [Candidatus Omnitrophota bacterium]
MAYLGKALSSSSIFTLKEVRSNIALDVQAFARMPEESVFDANLGKLYSVIYKEHPEYKNIYVVREFPSVIKVEITERKPFAQLKGEKLYFIDRDGVVISASDQQPAASSVLGANLIPIEIDDYNRRLRPGYVINDARLETAFKLIEELQRTSFLKKFPVQLINATTPGALYMVLGDTKVIFGKNDFRKKLYILDTIVRGELKGNLYPVEYIDLRYEKVYLGRKR